MDFTNVTLLRCQMAALLLTRLILQSQSPPAKYKMY
jgi:hypothetical protein